MAQWVADGSGAPTLTFRSQHEQTSLKSDTGDSSAFLSPKISLAYLSSAKSPRRSLTSNDEGS